MDNHRTQQNPDHKPRSRKNETSHKTGKNVKQSAPTSHNGPDAAKSAPLKLLVRRGVHDLNNVFGVIQGYAEILNEELKDKPSSKRLVERLLEICVTGIDKTGEIFELVSLNCQELVLVDLLSLVRRLESKLSASLPKFPHIHFQYPDEALWVLGNETLVGQTLLNLCRGLGEGLAQSTPEMTLSIGRDVPEAIGRWRSGTQAIKEWTWGERDEAKNYAYLCLTKKSDDGTEALLDRISEPDCHAKENHTEASLDLSVVCSIVESLGGVCQAAAHHDEGLVFLVLIPLAPPP